MASIPVVGTRWRCKATGDVYEVEQVGYDTLRGWLVKARLVGGGVHGISAKAHWFTTEGFEPVLEDAGA